MIDYLFTFSSLFAVLLCIIPGIFHIQTRNWGAIFMTFWVIAINLITFINSLLWANDLEDKARVYCIITTPIYVGGNYGILSSITCMIHTLYTYVASPMLLTERIKRRRMIRDIIVSLVFPAIGTALFYLVQTRIYGIRPILGCFSPAHKDWVFLLVNSIWPPIISGIGCYYAALTSYAIVKKRLEMQSILQFTEGLNTAKFYRLPYNFYEIHKDFWKVIPFTGDNLGLALFDYAKPLVGFFVFLFFGTGQDALSTYAIWARACKLHICFKCLEPKEEDGDGLHSTISTMRSIPSHTYQANGNMQSTHSPRSPRGHRHSITFPGSNAVAPPVITAQKPKKGSFNFLYLNGHRTPTEQAQFDLTSGIKIKIDGLDSRTMGNDFGDYDDLNEEPAPIYNRGIHETLERDHQHNGEKVLNDSDTFGSDASLKDHEMPTLPLKVFEVDLGSVSHIDDLLSVYPDSEFGDEGDGQVDLPQFNICPPTPHNGSYENHVFSLNGEVETFVANGIDDVAEDYRQIRNPVEIQVMSESVISSQSIEGAP
ncbi:13616_t:CDS:2 [Acaulospora morrowiae]|uniref:13616_t:CDS:1 n=1 Tax=Acaulospora morrowiae TaxID=94023 RepID=A0A9N8WSD5_9GLOM|nr:13616_t:CDS:2 [Acaulospora morrowiae]